MAAARWNQTSCVEWLAWNTLWLFAQNEHQKNALDIAIQLECTESRIILQKAKLRQERIL